MCNAAEDSASVINIAVVNIETARTTLRYRFCTQRGSVSNRDEERLMNQEHHVPDIVSRLKDGDEQALQTILHDYGPLLMRRLKSHFGLNDADLDDVLSVTLYRVWMNRERFDPTKGRFDVWLYLIARNIAIDHIRQEKRWPFNRISLLLEELPEASDAEVSSAERSASHGARPLKDLRNIVLSLPIHDRRILQAYLAADGQGSWASDLAEELRMSSDAIRVSRMRLLDKIRAEMIRRGHLAERECSHGH
jgi:RNA polymerase sigma factor (sigma-70 family)